MVYQPLKSKVLTKPFGFTSGIEGPACDVNGTIYAVNFGRQGTVGQVTPQGESSLFLTLPNGSVGSGIRIDKSGNMFVADHKEHNILIINIATKEVNVYAHESSMNQPNDIAITEKGILFASDPNWAQSTGQIWRIDTNGTVNLLEENMGTTNGIEVSPDNKCLYVNETVQKRIWVYDITENLKLINKRLLIEFPDYALDGMRCDIEGNLYVTRYGKGVVAKISPNGELLNEIILNGKNCTNLTFGGVDGRTCYVTVADSGSIEMFSADYPGRCWNMLQKK